MIKVLLVSIIMVSLFFLPGCNKDSSTSIPQQDESSSVSNETVPNTPEESTPPASTTTNNTLNYSQYIKKTWMKKEENNQKVYFSISKIENGKITGKLSVESFNQKDQTLPFFESDFEGTINDAIAECHYRDSKGNTGNLQLFFKNYNKMEATITIIEKSTNTIQPPEGTFAFTPNNIKNLKYFKAIESQSFTVNLNSWGNVQFVSGTLETGNHIPTVFYLTNQDGDILYNFVNITNFPYSVDVKAVSFKDVNKDGIKDIIIIVVDNYNGSNGHIANVYLQKNDGSFTNDYKLNEEINHSGNNLDVNSVTNYLSQKFH